MPEFVIERSIPRCGAATAADMQAISQKSCGVLRELGADVQRRTAKAGHWWQAG